jgi:ketosteroid isomerase-like protein
VRVDWRHRWGPPDVSDHARIRRILLQCAEQPRAGPDCAVRRDDADWLIVGPIELFAYCGQHFGKDAVLAAYGRMAAGNTTALHARDFLMTDGEGASALTRVTDVRRASGRQVMLRLAQFARFRDGKVLEFCSITDTLGAAAQVVGHALIGAADAPALAE